MHTETKSARAQLAERIASKIRDLSICNPYGGDVTKTKDSKNREIYSVLFSKPRNLDGSVAIYSDHFMLLRYKTRIQTLPHNGNQVFKDEKSLIEFIETSFK